MARLINADKYLAHLRANIDTTADIVDEQIKKDEPIGTVKDGGQIGYLMALQWARNSLELDCYTAEAIPKDEYENRLKADMVAMLTELKNELIDVSWNMDMYDSDLDFECCYLNDIDEIIQQKINSLEVESEG